MACATLKEAVHGVEAQWCMHERNAEAMSQGGWVGVSAGIGGARRRPARAGVRPEVRALVEDLLTGRAEPRMVLQPIVNLQGPRVVGFEALARLDPKGAVPPDAVIDAAWQLGVGPELELACAGAALSVLPMLAPQHFLTVNISPPVLATDAFDAFVEGRSLRRVVVELTEHVPLDDLPELPARLEGLRERGAFIAMDDTGAGYAGLAALLAIRPQFVKLDRTVVAGIDRDPLRSRLCQAFGAFLGEMDAWLLAEGVETRGELAEIVRIGVPLAQGYVFGRPSVAPADLRPSMTESIAHLSEARLRTTCVAPHVAPATRLLKDRDLGEPGWYVFQPRGEAPRAVVRRERDAGVRRWTLPLVVHDDDPPEMVLERAFLRGEESLSPIVVVGKESQVVGVVEPAALVRCVIGAAAQRDTSNHSPTPKERGLR